MVSPLSPPASSYPTAIGSTPPQTSQDEAFFRITFPSLFWPNLTLQRPPKTTPFGDPNRLKISPRPVLRRLCFKNVVFQNMSPALGESTILTLLGSQDGTKIGPRSPQDRLKIVLKRDRFLRRFLIDFWSSWAPFWLPFWHPRWVQKSIKRGPRVMW